MGSRSKASWRRQFRVHRRSLSPRSYQARSTLIAHRALTVPALADAKVVHTYWPLTAQREVDTRPLIAALRGWGAEMVLPVVTSFDADPPTLEHRRFDGPQSLTPNQWDIQEPVHTELISPDRFEVIIVPALGVGKNGHRVGHGSGYYDAFLQSVACPRIALTYEACLVSSVPDAAHDVPVTTIVTEQRVLQL